VLAPACARTGIDPHRDATAAPRPAGTVLILVDTLRADHLGAYGSPLGLTPHLDDLAEGTTLFERAIAPSSWTRSTVASLFTSRYPTSIGVLGREDAIAGEVVTLAEVLEAAGFETLAVSTNRNAGPVYGFDQGFDRFEVPDLTASYPGDFPIHVAEGVTRKALRFLDERDPGRPFFLFLHYVDPHDPYLPHPGLLDVPEPAGRFDGSRRDLSRLDALPAAEITEPDRARIRHLYAGEVRYCDLWIGALLRGLEERRLRDRVVVIVTSDHGEGLWDHGLRSHGRDLYEEQIRVPLIVDLPSAEADDRERRRVTEAVSLVDVAPTILAANGLAPEGAFRGADLMQLVRGRSRPRRHESVYSELALDGRDLEALRHRNQKLIRNRREVESRHTELYDLSVDPHERHDLAGVAQERRGELEAAIQALTAELCSEAVAAERVRESELDADTARSLAALGYLGGDAAPREASPVRAGELSPMLDFARGGYSEEQLVFGFHELENGRRWMAGRAEVVLARRHDASRWRLHGWIDLDLHGRESLTLRVVPGEGASQTRTLARSGFFTLEGPLPPSADETLRLRFDCDHELTPARVRAGTDRRRLCVIVRSVAVL
jgi:arylsulfatase A-like enzyme